MNRADRALMSGNVTQADYDAWVKRLDQWAADCSKSAGQLAYEADVTARPRYDDGTARKRWTELCEVARYSWDRNPTPRNWRA